MPAASLNSSPARCGEEPLPPEAKLSVPGLALASAISDWRSVAGTEGCSRSGTGALASMVTPVSFFSVS